MENRLEGRKMGTFWGYFSDAGFRKYQILKWGGGRDSVEGMYLKQEQHLMVIGCGLQEKESLLVLRFLALEERGTFL